MYNNLKEWKQQEEKTTLEKVQELNNKDIYYQTKNEGFYIQVGIKDFKLSYGRERYLIAPVSGEGKKWIETGLLVRDEKGNFKHLTI